MTQAPWRPTKQQLADAHGKTIADVFAPGLDVLFCGINPGLYSGAVGHHFARPGNRFWPALHLSGFTPRLLSPFEEDLLVEHGLGVTNLVARSTAAASELSRDELVAGAAALEEKVERGRPRYVAVLGVGAYRAAFRDRDAVVGPQDRRLGRSRVWLLPNTSGLNAHYQLPQLVEHFVSLRAAARH